MSRIALYGGSFDPFHICHQLVIPYALSLANVDSVIVAPVHTHAFGKKMVSFHHRMNMAVLGTQIFDGRDVQVLPIEERIAREKGKNLTIYTVEDLLAFHDTVVLILGTDIMKDLPKWESYSKLQELEKSGRLEFFFSNRGGHTRTDWFEINNRAEIIMPDVSSTQVRKAIKTGQPIDHLVPGNIVKYIKENKLYV